MRFKGSFTLECNHIHNTTASCFKILMLKLVSSGSSIVFGHIPSSEFSSSLDTLYFTVLSHSRLLKRFQ